MPSTRRLFLATAGTTLLSGCASFNFTGSDERRPLPAPFLTEADDWERPDYDVANTNAAPEYATPKTLSASVEWTAEFSAPTIDDGAGPVIADGIAYYVIAGTDGDEEFERLVAVDARTGEKRWRFEVQDSNFVYTLAPFSPSVGGETVFWLADRLYALSAADGSVQWTRSVHNAIPPIVAHRFVLAVSGTQEPVLEALDPTTGKPYWQRSEGERNWHLVAADDDTTYVTLRPATDSQTSELHALDPHTGETRWTSATNAPRTAALSSDHLFASTGRPDRQKLFALDIETREITWSETVDLQRTVGDEGVNGEQSVAALTENRVLVYHDFHGYLHDRVECRELESGDHQWTVTGTGDATVTLSPPVVAGDRVYLTEYRESTSDLSPSRLRVFSLADGTEQRTVTLAERSLEHPVVADGRVFIVTWQPDESASIAAL